MSQGVANPGIQPYKDTALYNDLYYIVPYLYFALKCKLAEWVSSRETPLCQSNSINHSMMSVNSDTGQK